VKDSTTNDLLMNANIHYTYI